MGAILGSVGLLVFLVIIVKICISAGATDNNSVMALLSDMIPGVKHREISRKERIPVWANYASPDYSQNNKSRDNEQASIPKNNASTDILINSPYYNKYRKTFDIIRYSGKEPKYRIDWLLKSLDMGHELEHDGVFVTASISENFPYFCETEEEFESLSKDDCLALKGSVAAIFGLGYLYSGNHMRSFLQEKRDYWRNQILNMANDGNLEARAGLCRKNLLFTEQEVEGFREKYEAELIHAAESGNPYAQLAVGQFLAKNRKEKLEWLNKAGEQGLSDAYYYLAVVYMQMRFLDDEFNYTQILLDEKEEQLIDKKIGECYLKGAEFNKGMMAVECQYNLANAYHYGYYGFDKDLTNAKYWYEKAFKNGKVYAGTCIENIEKFGE